MSKTEAQTRTENNLLEAELGRLEGHATYVDNLPHERTFRVDGFALTVSGWAYLENNTGRVYLGLVIEDTAVGGFPVGVAVNVSISRADDRVTARRLELL